MTISWLSTSRRASLCTVGGPTTRHPCSNAHGSNSARVCTQCIGWTAPPAASCSSLSGAARGLQEQFTAGRVHKRYLAVCRGHGFSECTVDHPLADEEGVEPKPAVTRLKLLNSFERYGLVEVTPITGRTHQIRRHLKHIAHPIIGDVRYGKGEHNRLFRERFDLHRLALHCAELGFGQPRTQEILRVEARPDGALLALFQRLGWLTYLENGGFANRS